MRNAFVGKFLLMFTKNGSSGNANALKEAVKRIKYDIQNQTVSSTAIYTNSKAH